MNNEKAVTPDYSFKLLLLGDAFVGKTSLLIRFKDKTFLKGSYISTVGIDYKTKLISCEGKLVKLQLWDTAGQERFRSLTKSYYRDADAVMLVYDVTKQETFVNIKSWLHDLGSHAPSSTVVAIVGNKMDDSGKRAVKTHDGASLAAENGALFLETSAKAGTNVDSAFLSITKSLIHRRETRGVDNCTENPGRKMEQSRQISLAEEPDTTKQRFIHLIKSCC
ncbi:ras protein Rab 26 [Echinococcus multilocularis]|uniref:Ras protein Rab 26 n=1 Tax=Echinococcus multilocularis TaxID=6211 RepID=A0A068Y2Q4_ECHMU|nr:ras protein Rab 26 [Echinococcus multilocularis]